MSSSEEPLKAMEEGQKQKAGKSSFGLLMARAGGLDFLQGTPDGQALREELKLWQANEDQRTMWMENEEKQKEKVGKANFEHLLAKAWGLEALKSTPEGQAWLESLVPIHSDEGKALDKELRKAVTEDAEAFLTNQDAFDHLEEQLNRVEQYLEKRIAMYQKALESEDAQKQVCTLIGLLDSMYLSGYTNIRDTWVVIGDRAALDELGEWCKEKNSGLKKILGKENDIASCYERACQPNLLQSYENLLKEIAGATGGQVILVPVKSPFRAKEKTAMRHDINDRFNGDNLYDVVRGCIVFHAMESILAAAKLLFGHKLFKVLRIVDRFSRPTTSGWCDILINGHFTKLMGNKHVVEIQLHHAKFISIRENLGGHFIYSIYRSLVEAVEVAKGKEEAKEMISTYSPKETQQAISDLQSANATLQDEKRKSESAYATLQDEKKRVRECQCDPPS